MNSTHGKLIWTSGFLAAIGVVHLLPLVIRHTLEIGGAYLSTEAAVGTTLVAFALSAVTAKLARGTKQPA